MTREKNPTRHAISIRHGDNVKVMSGRDKGKTGRVLSVNPWKNTVTVEHANIIKRHTRPNPQKNVKGGIVDKEAPLQVSNVMLVCPSCNQPTRVAHKFEGDVKVRICKKCGGTIAVKKK